MTRKAKKSNDSNQLSFFAEINPTQPSTSATRSYPHLDRLEQEDKRIRASFTSKEAYYQSPQWQSKKQQKFNQVGRKCEVCGTMGRLDVHHLNYDSLYDERMEDLQVLCRYHHVIADGDREYSSAFNTFVYKRHGDYAWSADLEREGEMFDEWLESKREGW